MIVALTGGTGLVGGAVLRELVDHGHQVTALVRSEESADAVRSAGANPVVGDLTDQDWLRGQLAAADGAIHTASPGDASSADFDQAVVESVIAAYGDTDKPYVHTSGCWVYGSGDDLTEETPFAAPQLTAWRQDVEKHLLDSGVTAGIVAPGIVYDAADATAGLAGMITQPDDQGRYHLVGDGSQHWTTVSTGELAELYRLVLESPQGHGYFLGINEAHPTVREIVEAAAGGAEVVAETPEQSGERLPELLVEALLLDQIGSAARAHTLVEWAPGDTPLLEVLAG